MNKNIIILGSTGSIGTQSIDVIKSLNKFSEEKFNVVALSTNNNIELLANQCRQLKPQFACVTNLAKVDEFKKLVFDLNIKVLAGNDGLLELANFNNYDLLINAVVGNVGLLPTVQAIKNKKNVAIANKETLVSAGKIVMDLVKQNNVMLYPIDSEHSAIFQCLQGNKINEVNKIILTASGGPFRDFDSLDNVTLDQALNHPNWKMGAKITIDSATLMNKGLEVIEAKWLFDLPIEKIKVVIHPQSIIHSMVEYDDSSIIAQLGTPDMKVPIQYALTYPKRVKNDFEKLDFLKIGSLTFKEPNYKLFKCLSFAFDAIKIGGTLPCVLNASNEIAVQKFLDKKISFNQIPIIIEKTILAHNIKKDYSLDDIIMADKWAREYALNIKL